MVLTSSDEDEPILIVKPKEEKPKEEPKETQDAGEKRKADSSAAEVSIDLTDSQSSDVLFGTSSPPAKKAKPEPAKAQKEQPKSAKKATGASGEFSDDEEEDRFLALMTQHGSSAYAAPKPATPAKPAASASSAASGSAKKVKEEKEKGEKGEASTKEETGMEKYGSAKVDASSKIKFSRSLPLMVPNAKRVSRSTFIVQIEDPSLDFEGDSGVVGTIKSSESSLHLDVKGQLYEGSILACNTMMVVDVGPSEIKVEAVINDFVQLHAVANPHDEDLDVDLSDDGGDALDSDDDEPKAKGKKGGKSKGKDTGKKAAAKKKPAKKAKPSAKKKVK